MIQLEHVHETSSDLVLDGRYRLATRRNASGNGTLYDAHDLELNRQVSVRVFPASGPSAPVEHASALSKLSHQHVATIHDFGHDHRRGLDYLVMQRLSDETLAGRLAAVGRLDYTVLRPIMRQILRGMAAIHASGHVMDEIDARYISLEPGSGAGPLVKILDFAILDDAPDDVTVPRPPETLLGRAPAVRTNVYHLGAMFFHAVTGQHPIVAVGGRRHESLFTELQLAQLPDAVSVMLEDSLSRDPAFRPRDIADMLSHLHARPYDTLQ